MKIWLKVLCLSCLFTSQIFAQKKFSKTEILKDLVYIDQKLSTYYLGLYYYTDSTTLHNELNDIKKNIPDSLSEREAYRVTAKYISRLQDLHTSTNLPKNLQKDKKPKTIPLSLRQINGKVYIHYNMSEDSSFTRGAELLEINNEPINQVFTNLQTLYGADNDNPSSKNYYSERSFSTFYYRYYGTSDSTKILIKPHPDSLLVSKTILNLEGKKSLKILKSRYKDALRSNFEFVVLDTVKHIAKLDITSFTAKKNRFDISQKLFKRKLKARFKEIEEKGIEHLIIDFRANGGGLINNINRVTQYVSSDYFNLTDSMNFKPKSYNKIFPFYTIFPPIIGKFIFKKTTDGNYIQRNKSKKYKKPIKKYHFDKNLYVLMDGGSYSATTFTIGLWKDMDRATFVGTRPGGADWGSFAGRWASFKTPNSKTPFRIPLFKIVHDHPNKTNNSLFIEPDYNVENNLKDFLKRKDTQRDFVLDIIK